LGKRVILTSRSYINSLLKKVQVFFFRVSIFSSVQRPTRISTHSLRCVSVSLLFSQPCNGYDTLLLVEGDEPHSLCRSSLRGNIDSPQTYNFARV
jgi:hypothetical protein